MSYLSCQNEASLGRQLKMSVQSELVESLRMIIVTFHGRLTSHILATFMIGNFKFTVESPVSGLLLTATPIDHRDASNQSPDDGFSIVQIPLNYS